MGNLNGYNAEGGATMEERDTLPAGEYVATIVKSEKKESKSGGNFYINLEFAISEGQYEGRRFWGMLNLWNTNSIAVDIAQRELNSICHAIGRLRVDDSEELHGIPMRVTLGVKEDKQYGAQNVIKGYKPLNAPAGGNGADFRSSRSDSGGTSSAPWNS